MKLAEANRVVHNTSRRKTCSQRWVVTWALLLLFQIVLGAPAADSQVGSSAASLRVRVTDSLAETPIERARVELMRFPDGVMQQGFSDASGTLEFSGLASQTYVLRATKHGYLDAEVQVDVRRGEFAKSVALPMQRTPLDRNEASQGSVAAGNLSIPDRALKEFQLGAKFLSAEKNPRQSVVHFQRAIEISPDYFDAHFLLGMAYVQLNTRQDAQAEFVKALQLNPKSLSPYYPLSVLLFSQKRFAEEERLLLQALEMDKQGWQWPFELARCYAGQGSWEKALQYGKLAHELPNAPSKTHLLMADLYSNTGDMETAARELEDFVRLDPESPYIPRAQQALDQLRHKR